MQNIFKSYCNSWAQSFVFDSYERLRSFLTDLNVRKGLEQVMKNLFKNLWKKMARCACEAKLRRVLLFMRAKKYFQNELLLPFYYIHTTYQTSISKRQFSLEKKVFLCATKWWWCITRMMTLQAWILADKKQVKNQKILINFLQISTQMKYVQLRICLLDHIAWIFLPSNLRSEEICKSREWWRFKPEFLQIKNR